MNKNTIYFTVTLLLFSLSGPLFARHNEGIEDAVKPLPSLPLRDINGSSILSDKSVITDVSSSAVINQKFYFPELEQQIEHYSMTAMMPPPGDNLGTFLSVVGNGKLTAVVKKAKQVIDKALEIGKSIDLLTGGDLVKMPIYKTQTYGNTDVTIVFNSAKIYPQYAVIEVFAKIELPQKDFDGQPVVLYFSASDIYFSQDKGIIRGSLRLLADFAFKLGDDQDPKGGIWLSKAVKGAKIKGMETTTELDDEYAWTGTYINFDCEGFKEMGIGGRVYFSRDWVLPADENGAPLTVTNDDKSETPRTHGAFQIIVQDWNDILVSVDIQNPFVLTKWPEMSFELVNANLDLSSYRNPVGIPVSYNIQPNLWEGVYIDTISIMLPTPFKRAKKPIAETGSPPPNGNYPQPERERIKISAEHLLIDEAGVSAHVSVSGQVPLIGGALMGGEWGYSLDEVSVDLVQSDITHFHFQGELGAPIFSKDGPLTYSGDLVIDNQPYDPNIPDEYIFTVGDIGQDATIPIWNAARLEIGQPALTADIHDGEFDASLSLPYLKMELGNDKDFATSQTGSTMKMPGVKITDLTLSTQAPYFSYGGLELQLGNGKLMNFPVTITGYDLSSPPNLPDELDLGFTVNLNLMSQNENGANASGDFKFIGDYKRDINGARHWLFKKFEFEGAEVTVSMPNVWAHGTLCLFEDDDTYGKGFYANAEARIIGKNLAASKDNAKFNVDMMAIFGNTGAYRYFLVDGFASGDAINVPLFGPFYLNGFGGGVFHNMRPYDFPQGGTTAPAGACAASTSTSGIIYKPNSETRFGLEFATSVSTTSNLMKGLLTCIIRFDQHMVLQNITFWGVADIMLPSKLSSQIKADINELHAKVNDNILSETQAEEKAHNDTFGSSVNGIRAKLGLSFDFEQDIFHGFADVNIVVHANPSEESSPIILQGRGMVDLLLSAKDWHFYLGGYYPGQGTEIKVPGFFNPESMVTLSPVNVNIDYKNFKVSANAYFLTGNTIPGAPPPAPEVVAFFGPESKKDNRELLNCSPSSQAMGTGIAFGASAFFDFSAFKKGKLGCLLGYKVNVEGGVGFDLALLKFDPATTCSLGNNNNQQKQGLNGFRAGGRLYAFVKLHGKHVTCFPIPPLALGLLLRFDVPNPSYFQVIAVIKIGRQFRLKANIGEECGAPCVSSVHIE